MTDLRKAARGMECQVRLPCCNGNPETTVAAHYRSISLGAGVGIKPHDLLSAHACSACHDAIDGRVHVKGHSKIDVRLAHCEGVLRTIDQLLRKGLIAGLERKKRKTS